MLPPDGARGESAMPERNNTDRVRRLPISARTALFALLIHGIDKIPSRL